MKIFLLLSICCINFGLYAQNISTINADLGLQDSLTYETEIRVYQGGGITNYSSLIRIYKDTSDQWTATYYEHWSKVDGVMDLKTQKKVLTSKSDMEYVYFNLIRSYIFDLPSRNEILWKLAKRGEIQKVERRRGRDKKPEMVYDILSTQSMPLDGTGYYFQAKNSYKSNEFEFGDPFWYKEKYPKINEPNYVCELITIIQNEFGIWQSN